jgi:hypothetical protein
MKLEKDAVECVQEARRVAEYDAKLRDSQRSLSALSEQTSYLITNCTVWMPSIPN